MASEHADSVPQAKVRPPEVRALWRDRLAAALEGVWRCRLTLVVGPAGSGKTTLLASFAARAAVPVAWLRLDAADATPEAVARGLAAAVRVAGHDPGPVGAVEELVAGLDRWGVPAALIVVDDLHEVAGTAGEAAIERVATYLPAGLHLLVASRRQPGFNLPRLRLSGELLELTPDDLRFRSWEVEQLFRDVYNEPLAPEDLAALARRTGGWAAALALFHLATEGKPPAERRRLLAGLAGRSRMVREYLSHNLLAELPDDLRAFLLRTSVLGRLTPGLCDALLGRTGSARVLAELERRQLFTVAVGDDAFRYHEVLRSHLETVLVEELGEAQVAELCRQAGALLFDAGYLPEALRAFWRAGDWAGVARVLGTSGEELAAISGEWLEAISDPLVDYDPWLLLATSRRHLALGRPRAAQAAYQRADQMFGPGPAGESCRRERRDLALWLDAPLAPRQDWLGRLRAALGPGAPSVLREATGPDPHSLLVAGVAGLAAGAIPTGAERLRLAAEHPEASPLLSLVARVLAATADLLAGRGDAPGLDALADEADALGWPWIARLAHGVRALSGWPERLDDAARARAACREQGDEWGDAVLGLAEGLGRIRAGTPDPRPLVASAATFARLGATTLEAWARAGEVLALALTGGASTRALARAEAAVRASEADGPLALLVAARELLGERPARPAAAIAGECGLALPVGPPAPPGSRAPETPPPVRVRCFGGLAVERDGSPVDLSAVKPRARAVLQVLAVHGGAPVHREVLLDALWPDADVATGVRNLQVAISTLRHVLDTAGGQSLIQRDGDSYRLALPAGAIDVCAFEAALAEARGAEGAAAVAALDRALALYAGELLPEAGPAEWVLKARESCRMQAAEAAQRLATVLADAGDLGGARTACRRGLEIDRYRDGLWQALIAVLERAGEPAAAASARREYRRVLAELGIDHGLGAGSSGPPGEAGRP